MKRALLFALFFTIVYILVFAAPLKKQPVFTPQWVQNLTDPSKTAGPQSNETVGFRIGDVFGYVTPEGAIKYLDTAQFNVAMSGARFINYSSVSKNLVVKDNSGRITMTVASRGYPIFMAGRFFTIDTDRMAISELDNQGNVLWSRDFGSLITSIEANSTNTVVGLLSGSVVVLDKRGDVTYSYSPGGSRIAAIYGCAISSDGTYIAVVSGLEPQRFVLLHRDASGYRPRRIVDLKHELRRQVLLHFYPKIPYVYVESSGAVDYFALGGSASGAVKVDGQVAGMAAGSGPLIYAVSEKSSSSTGSDPRVGSAQLTVFTPSGEIMTRSSFPAGQLFLKAEGDAVYLGSDTRIARFDYVVD